MLLVREVLNCKPGKVRPLVEKSLKMAKLSEENGLPKMKVMTDFCGDQYWTIVYEMEVANLQEFEDSMSGKGMSEEVGKEFEKIIEGYHDLVDHGHREIFKIEA